MYMALFVVQKVIGSNLPQSTVFEILMLQQIKCFLAINMLYFSIAHVGLVQL